MALILLGHCPFPDHCVSRFRFYFRCAYINPLLFFIQVQQGSFPSFLPSTPSLSQALQTFFQTFNLFPHLLTFKSTMVHFSSLFVLSASIALSSALPLQKRIAQTIADSTHDWEQACVSSLSFPRCHLISLILSARRWWCGSMQSPFPDSLYEPLGCRRKLRPAKRGRSDD